MIALCNTTPNIVEFSPHNLLILNPSQITCVHVISGIDVWQKLFRKGINMPLMNRLNAQAIATLGAGKYNDGAGLYSHFINVS